MNENEKRLSKLLGQYSRKEINKETLLRKCTTVKANTTYVAKYIDGSKDDVGHPVNTLDYLLIIYDVETAREIWQAMKK